MRAFALAALGLLGCYRQDVQPALVYPVERVPQISLPRVTPGRSEHTVTVDGRTRRFVVLAPESLKRDHPMVVYLHGALSNRGAMGQPRVSIGAHERLMECLFGVEFRSLAPVIVMPVSTVGAGGEWWTESESSFVVALLDAAKRTWPIDPAHTVVAGFSNGGIGAWTIARLYPQRLSAAIPIAFDSAAVGETRVPVFAIQGTKDELFDHEPIERRIQQLQRQGQPITFVSKYRGLHFRGCDYAPQVAEAAVWLSSKIWDERAKPTLPPK